MTNEPPAGEGGRVAPQWTPPLPPGTTPTDDSPIQYDAPTQRGRIGQSPAAGPYSAPSGGGDGQYGAPLQYTTGDQYKTGEQYTTGEQPPPAWQYAQPGQPATPPQYGAAPQYGTPPDYSPPQYGTPPQYGATPEYAPPPQYGAAPQYGTTPEYAPPPQYGAAPQYGATSDYAPPLQYGAAPQYGAAQQYGSAPQYPADGQQPGSPPLNPQQSTGGFAPLPNPPPGYGQPQFAYPGSSSRPAPTPGMNVLAIITLVLGALGGVGLAVILGIISLVQIKRSGQRGKPLAIIGMVLSGLWAVLIGVVVFLAISTSASRNDAGAITKGGTVLVSDVRTGDCIEHWSTAGSVGEVNVVPCTSAHDAEVFQVFTVAGTGYPGDRQVTAQATKQCLATAKTALKPADQSKADIAYFKPLAASWNQGDHTVACIAVSKSGTLNRTVRA